MRGKVSFPWSSVVAFGGEVCIRGRGQRGADSKLKLGGRRRPKTGLLGEHMQTLTCEDEVGREGDRYRRCDLKVMSVTA